MKNVNSTLPAPLQKANTGENNVCLLYSIIVHLCVLFLDNQYLVSPKVNHMEGDIGYVCLLVVAPDHRRADYVWEKWEQSDWIKLNVPNHTCILYAWSIGRYRCQVSEKTYQFHVIGK